MNVIRRILASAGHLPAITGAPVVNRAEPLDPRTARFLHTVRRMETEPPRRTR